MERAREHGRRDLAVHQHHVGSARAQAGDAVREGVAERLRGHAAQRRIGARLPDHELRPLRQHLGIQPRQHLGNVLPADPAVHHPHLVAGQRGAQQRLQPRRVGVPGRARPRALRGGGAEGDDGERLPRPQRGAARGQGQRPRPAPAGTPPRRAAQRLPPRRFGRQPAAGAAPARSAAESTNSIRMVAPICPRRVNRARTLGPGAGWRRYSLRKFQVRWLATRTPFQDSPCPARRGGDVGVDPRRGGGLAAAGTCGRTCSAAWRSGSSSSTTCRATCSAPSRSGTWRCATPRKPSCSWPATRPASPTAPCWTGRAGPSPPRRCCAGSARSTSRTSSCSSC